MRSSRYNRRKFLSAVTASAAGAALINSNAGSLTANAPSDSSPFNPANKSEYFFTDGLTYLNTGTIGPCRRETVRESMRDWEELESFPVKFYGKSGAENLAEKTRTIAARF